MRCQVKTRILVGWFQLVGLVLPILVYFPVWRLVGWFSFAYFDVVCFRFVFAVATIATGDGVPPTLRK